MPVYIPSRFNVLGKACVGGQIDLNYFFPVEHSIWVGFDDSSANPLANIRVGSGQVVSENNAIVIGHDSTASYDSITIGNRSRPLYGEIIPSQNIYIGHQIHNGAPPFSPSTFAVDSIVIGNKALFFSRAIESSLIVGNNATSNAVASYSIVLGNLACAENTRVVSSVVIGQSAGEAKISDTQRSIFIGFRTPKTVGVSSSTFSNTVAIGQFDEADTFIPDGNYNNFIGIGFHGTDCANDKIQIGTAIYHNIVDIAGKFHWENNVASFKGVAKSDVYTVATLPNAATVGMGARAFVSDALLPTFGNTVTGGGTVPVPVYSDGTAWRVG